MRGTGAGEHRARVAAAPISWGVCEVPGWGVMAPPAQVLGSMRSLGVTATELGPPGWLPPDPAALRPALSAHGLSLVAGFLAVPLHLGGAADRAAVLARVRASATALAGAGASLLVLAAATGSAGYDERPHLDDAGWERLVERAGEVEALAAGLGLTTVLHPHAGTLVEAPEEVERFLGASDLGLCLDTGHSLVGGGDPLALARAHADRVRHVHLKDVDAALAGRVRAGEVAYADAIPAGLFRPLGAGDVDVAGIVAALEGAGYDGWYVMEQDVRLPAATPEELAGAEADVRTGLALLAELGLHPA